MQRLIYAGTARTHFHSFLLHFSSFQYSRLLFGSGVHPASCPMGTGDSVPRGKAAGV
jgi:hypothetical protein